MKSMQELENEINITREELEAAMTASSRFEDYYNISLKLDRLLEEYIERKEMV